MNSLIGQKFRRNKYGLSDWTKTIQQVSTELVYEKIENIFVAKPKYKVSSDIKLSFVEDKYEWFYLDEIVLVSDDVTKWGQILEVAAIEGRKLKLSDYKEFQEYKNDKNE